MKKPLSNMSAQEFVEHVGALGLRYADMAERLHKSQPAISRYANGHQRIPQDVADELRKLIDAKVAELTARGETIKAQNTIGSLIVYHNEARRKRPERHHTQGRFMRRQGHQDTRTFPAYRMSVDRFRVYAEALLLWRERIRELALEHGDEPRQRDYRLELADLKQLAATAPRNAPYEVCITRVEWGVVSRALRHMTSKLRDSDAEKAKAADSLRCHWLKYRGSGYPINRSTQEGQT